MKAALPVEANNTYGQILKSSSIIGGAQGITYIIGMLRTKLVAVLLGPSGVGLVGLYASVAGLVGTIAGLGLDSSGVREVAEAHGHADAQRLARTAQTLRRVCWLTGLVGWVLTAVFSYPLSVWTFGSPERAWAIALLGGTVCFGAVAGGRTALIQGTRRIGDLARLNVMGAFGGTIIAVGLYWWLGERGIVPVLLATAALNLGGAWWLSRRIQIVPVAQTWTETLTNSKRLVTVGLAFMYGAVLAGAIGLAIRATIVRQLGLDANGIYQAAWSLSGLFAAFILNAMGADFYPRLTAVAYDNGQVNRLVNEQIEVGTLLALPGIMGTFAFAPSLLKLLYSSEFLAAGDLLRWFAVGVFGQIVTWPIGMIAMAKGATGWIYFGRTQGSIMNLALAMALVQSHGLVGSAWGFALFSFANGAVAFCISRHLSMFALTAAAVRLLVSCGAIVAVGFAAISSTRDWLQIAVSGSFLLLACDISVRGLVKRLGASHRLVRMLLRAPGLGRMYSC